MFAVFISERRKNIAIAFLAGRKLITGKGNVSKGMAAQQAATAMVLMIAADMILSNIYGAFAKAKPEDEDSFLARLKERMLDAKAWGYKVSTNHLTGIPVFGQAWEFAMSKAWGQKSFNRSPNPVFRTVESVAEFGDIANDKKSTSERMDAATKMVQGLGQALPGGPVFSQAANGFEFLAGALESSGVSFSEKDRRARVKARYNKAVKDLDDQYGKTMIDGKVDKEVKAKKDSAKFDIINDLVAPLPEEQRAKVLDDLAEDLQVSEKTINDLKMHFGNPRK
jgi:hypothetical protein